MRLTHLLPVLVLTLSAGAETITLTPAADTAMLSLNPANNYGALTTVPVGPIAKPDQFARALIRFDVAAALPPGAVVTNVTLTVRMTKEAISGPADTVALHRLLVDWGEGAKSSGNHGSAATAGEANWTARKLGAADWAAPGAQSGTDFAAAASGSLVWNAPGSYTFASAAGLIADVQSWLDTPAQNQGWLLKSDQESTVGAAKRMVTREGSAAQRPQLVIGYSVPVPFKPTLPAPRLIGGDIELSYPLAPGNTYELRALNEPGAPTFTVLTNHTVKLTGIEATYAEPASAAQRFYQLVITGQVD
ncbi:MAG: hypothetical protein RL303_1397 [Verrucomicrobiota bacterium]